MRKLLMLAAASLAGAAFAADTFTRTPVEVPVMEFKAVLNDGRVITTWRRYKRDDFLSYHLVKSSSKDSPVYPEEPAIFWTRYQDTTGFDDGQLSAGTWRYRLCIVTRFGERWVSPVVTITVQDKDVRRSTPTAADFE